MTSSRHRWIFWYATTLHAVWGVILLTAALPYHATALSTMIEICGSHRAVGIVLLAAVLCAADSLLGGPLSRRVPPLMLLAPQQLVMIATAVSVVIAVAESAYADGVLRPRGFILADQLPHLVGVAWQTVALVVAATEPPPAPVDSVDVVVSEPADE